MNDSRTESALEQAVQEGSSQTAVAPGDGSKQRPRGFARVARQISSRATDLLGISIIAIAGLMMGEYLTDWWSTDNGQSQATQSADSLSASTAAWTANGSAVNLQFADEPYALSRQILSGDLEQAVQTLKQNCLTILTDQDSASSSLGEITLAERRLLDASANIAPVEAQPGKWQVFRMEKPIPMVVGTRFQPRRGSHDQPPPVADRGTPDSERSGGDRENGHLQPRHMRRVVCWGLTFPSGSNSWTLYTYRATTRSPSSSYAVPSVDLPPGSRTVLALRSPQGNGLVVFRGHGSANTSAEFYRGWFGMHDWRPLHAWKRFPQGWSARYHKDSGVENITVDIQIREDRLGGLDGVLNVYAARRISVEKKR